MNDQKPSVLRVAFGSISAVAIIYAIYSLGMSVYMLAMSTRPVEPPSTPQAKAWQDVGVQVAQNYTATAAEFGALRGLFCLFIGVGGLLFLNALDTLEQSRAISANILRELARQNQSP